MDIENTDEHMHRRQRVGEGGSHPTRFYRILILYNVKIDINMPTYI